MEDLSGPVLTVGELVGDFRGVYLYLYRCIRMYRHITYIGFRD